MIRSFHDRTTELIWFGETTRRLPFDIQHRALKRLKMLDAAASLDDLQMPPSNRLHALAGDRLGSIRFP